MEFDLISYKTARCFHNCNIRFIFWRKSAIGDKFLLKIFFIGAYDHLFLFFFFYDTLLFFPFFEDTLLFISFFEDILPQVVHRHSIVLISCTHM